MKSLAELQEIRNKVLGQVNLRKERATCGIAAGARPVLNAFLSEIGKRELKDVMVTQTGCIGMCRLEPIVEIYMPGEEKVTYVKMTEDKVARVVAEHIVNKQPVVEYTIGAVKD